VLPMAIANKATAGTKAFASFMSFISVLLGGSKSWSICFLINPFRGLIAGLANWFPGR
jgi:hypothetical protein